MKLLERAAALALVVGLALLALDQFRGKSDAELALANTRTRWRVDSLGWEAWKQNYEELLRRADVTGDSLRRTLAAANDESQRSLGTLTALLKQLPEGERGKAEHAAEVIVHAGEVCSEALGNCDQRVAAQRALYVGALGRVAQQDTTIMQLNVITDQALQDARPHFLRDLWRAKPVLIPTLLVSGACLLKK